ncbi:MAG: PIN domain-containing protein [Desulfuromonadales bacterium]|nr:PIN domain-containing protein [Desulfuromonadales bacterium]
MDTLRPTKLPGNQRYALDTVTLIYFLEQHPQYYQAAKKIFKKIEAGEISAVISTLVFAELLVPAFRSKENKRAEKVVRILSNFPNLKIIPLTVKISTAAAHLRATHGLRTPDAIHAATALESKTRGIITNDKGFQKIASPDFGVWLFDNG